MKLRSPGSLRRELLASFAILVGAALSLAVLTALIAQALQPRYAPLVLIALILADVGLVFAFGRYLLDRLVLRPVELLQTAADQLAEGNLDYRAPPAETREFTELAERFNRMTEGLREIQAQLVRTEKLATVGRLAAGIAHEVGNPLGAIGTYVQVLAKRGADPDIVKALMEEASRIDRIVRGLLDYARPQDHELGPIDLGEVITRARDLLQQQGALKTAALRVELDGVPLPVRGRVHGLEQVVVNLLLNAVDAAPRGPIVLGAKPWRFEPLATGQRQRDGGSQTGRRSAAGSRRPWRRELPAGTPGVMLYVADGGPGVAQEDREKVFEPFYTTKPPGQGTGLGLAIVQRTVYELGGVVWIEEAREGGAAFKIFLPSAGPP